MSIRRRLPSIHPHRALGVQDLLGGEVPTRFKYRAVEATGFGVTDEELLQGEEKKLAERVPIRFIKRPYANWDEARVKRRAKRKGWEAQQEERRGGAQAAEASAAKPRAGGPPKAAAFLPKKKGKGGASAKRAKRSGRDEPIADAAPTTKRSAQKPTDERAAVFAKLGKKKKRRQEERSRAEPEP